MPSLDASSRRTMRDGRSSWLILFLACACQFVVILDSAIVNVALPSVRRDLGFDGTDVAWVVNGYLLTFGGFMLLGGRCADLFGQRRTLSAGLFVFGAASLAGGLAGAPNVLVAARVAQGVGAAMLAPATLAVLNTSFTEPRVRARAFGAWSAAGGVGGMAGAILGGAITTGLSWRWVFLINVPVATVLIVAAISALAGSRGRRRKSLDVAGALTGTAGLGALIYGLMQSAAHSWASSVVAVPIAAGLVLLVAFVAVEGRVAAHPMMPLRLFRTRNVALGSGMLSLFGAVAIAMWFFTSLYLQNVLGYSALRAGLGQTPAAVTFLVMARWAAVRLPRTGVRPLVLVGGSCLLVGFGWLSRTGAESHYASGVLGPTLLIAVGIGLTFPTLMTVATSGAPPGDVGIVGGLASTSSQVGGALGLALLAAAASARSNAADEGSTSVAALAAGYNLVFLAAAALGLAIAALSIALPGGRAGGRPDPGGAAIPVKPQEAGAGPGLGRSVPG